MQSRKDAKLSDREWWSLRLDYVNVHKMPEIPKSLYTFYCSCKMEHVNTEKGPKIFGKELKRRNVMSLLIALD